MKRLGFAALLVLAPLEQAFPWGQEGHSIVAEIAQRRLGETTQQKVNALLASEFPDLKGAHISLASIASWPDDYRADNHDESSNWHFVDIPYDRDAYNAAVDCKLDAKYGDCVVNALSRFTAALADCSKLAGERVMALKFVVHFVGDLHQPLHATERTDPETGKGDRGGNTIHLTFFDKKTKQNKTTDLHKLWDSEIILQKVYDWGEYVRLLETQWLPGKDIATLQAGNPIDWAQDAHKAARLVAYNFRPDHVIDEEYFRDSTPIVDRQLALAGVRLARVLNDALKPTRQCP